MHSIIHHLARMDVDKRAILAEEYADLIGMTFTARKIGDFSMETGQQRTALEIEDPAMTYKLGQIRNNISQRIGDEKNIWKAITGPEDGYEHYWLWVTPIALQDAGCYKIIEIETFGKNPKYEAGVSITVQDQ